MRGSSLRGAKIQQGGQGENSFTCFPLCHNKTGWVLTSVEMQLLIISWCSVVREGLVLSYFRTRQSLHMYFVSG